MELQQQYSDDVQFVSVPEPAPDVAAALDFVEGTGIDAFTNIHDPDGLLWSTFDVTRRQTYFVIADDGTPTEVDFDDLAANLAALVG